MKTVLIVDDEAIIRNGIKYLLDWALLGFVIIGEAANGESTLSFILENHPDVVLLDICIPKMSGLDVARESRLHGFKGKFIILSGYSDFKYAQEAIRYGVKFYLTKPIDEDNLKEILHHISEQLDEESLHAQTLEHYREKAKRTVLQELLFNLADIKNLNLKDMNMEADMYQVVIYKKYNHSIIDASYQFVDLLKLTNKNNNSYDKLTIDRKEIILLKGTTVINKFNDVLELYKGDKKSQTCCSLDALFLTYGHAVFSLEDINYSYEEADLLQQRRFLCEIEQHIIGYNDLPILEHMTTYNITPLVLQEYCNRFVNYLQTFNRNVIATTLQELTTKIYYSSNDINTIKLLLTDFYLQIKEKIGHLYNTFNIPFPTNSWIIDFIETKYYLYEIILFFNKQFEMIMTSIGHSSSESIMNDILCYIDHNYMNNIKLETIAPLFGYNISYLGKIFNKKIGKTFNSYVDYIRIDYSKKLLEETSLKVYEIAPKVGYLTVDYFHLKFKKYVGVSPAEYRKKYHE